MKKKIRSSVWSPITISGSIEKESGLGEFIGCQSTDKYEKDGADSIFLRSEVLALSFFKVFFLRHSLFLFV